MRVWDFKVWDSLEKNRGKWCGKDGDRKRELIVYISGIRIDGKKVVIGEDIGGSIIFRRELEIC